VFYRLTRKKIENYDTTVSAVVRADTEIQARNVLARACVNEGSRPVAAWLEPKLSTCEAVLPRGPAEARPLQLPARLRSSLVIAHEGTARAATRIERDPGRAETRALYTVVLPHGWCFEQGRHTSVEETRSDAEQTRLEEPIELCEPDCDCLLTKDSP
jgi:hypothetical protein